LDSNSSAPKSIDEVSKQFLRAYGMGGMSMDGHRSGRLDLVKSSKSSSKLSTTETSSQSKDETAAAFINKYGLGGFGYAPTPLPYSSKPKSKAPKEKKTKNVTAKTKPQNSENCDPNKVASDFINKFGFQAAYAPTPVPTQSSKKNPSTVSWRTLFSTQKS